MRRIAVIVMLVAACQAGGGASSPPTAGPTPTGAAGYPERLIADLGAGGARVRVGQVFAADPFRAEGFVLCVGTEPVRMYVFPSIGDRAAAAAKIDPTNPSSVGTAMVSWNGRPRMWQVDRLLLVYLGQDAPTEALLKNVLGAPFASGEGRALLPDDSCG